MPRIPQISCLLRKVRFLFLLRGQRLTESVPRPIWRRRTRVIMHLIHKILTRYFKDNLILQPPEVSNTWSLTCTSAHPLQPITHLSPRRTHQFNIQWQSFELTSFFPHLLGWEGRAGQLRVQLLCRHALRWGNAVWGLTPEMLQKG